MAMSDEWDELERDFAGREQYGALRSSIAAMRRLVDRIKADGRLRDLEPSVSLGALVFRRSSRRPVMVSWNDDLGYEVAFVSPGFEISESKAVAEEGVLDALRDYLDAASVPHIP